MTISDETRVYRWERLTRKTDHCWEWIGFRTKNGYGLFRWDTQRRITAHRAAYLLFVGPIPEGYEIDHAVCQNRGCVRPSHLEAVTVAVNRSRQKTATGAATRNGKKTQCDSGHPLEGDNLRVNRDGSRACRECGRDAMRRYRARQ